MRAWGAKRAGQIKLLDVDPGGDCLELADPFAANPELTISVTGNNLFDVNARRHSSELKDYAPLAGRDIRVTARARF